MGGGGGWGGGRGGVGKSVCFLIQVEVISHLFGALLAFRLDPTRGQASPVRPSHGEGGKTVTGNTLTTLLSACAVFVLAACDPDWWTGDRWLEGWTWGDR